MKKEENDPVKQIEQFKLRIKEKGIVQQSLLDYFGISVCEIHAKKEKSEELYRTLKEYNVLTNKCEFREFLKAISHLWDKHKFIKKLQFEIENLFKLLKEDLKNIFSENEIFVVFHKRENNFILLILVEQNILSVEAMIKNFRLIGDNDWSWFKYFYPEIRKYDIKYFNELILNGKGRGLKEFVELNDRNLEDFYEIRKGNKKDPKIIELIREDKVEEFISFIEHYPIDLNKKIQKEDTTFGTKFGTLFGTMITKLTLIEYSAFFGSVAIFKYLYLKNVNIKIIVEGNISNIIEYAIQGRNYEIIHLLEERKEIIQELNNQKNQQKYLKISINMHHNEIFEYLMINYNIQVTEEMVIFIIKCRNYQLFDQLIERNQIEFKNKAITNIFYRICKNENEEIVEMLINLPNLDINSKNRIFDQSFEMNKSRSKRKNQEDNIHCY